MGPRVATQSWLSVTPEPEGERPAALAALRCGGEPDAAAVERERRHIERIVLQGGERDWLDHLSAAIRLIEAKEHDTDPAVAGARAVAIQVIANHHNLLL